MDSIRQTYHFQSKSFCTFLNSAHSDADKIGPAVYTARAFLRGTYSQRQEFMNDCEKVYPASNVNRQSSQTANVVFDNKQSDFSVLPNPASNSIIINHYGNYDQFQIAEINGKIVYNAIFNSNLSSELFDVSNLANGIYILDLKGFKTSSKIKLVINK